MNERAFAVLDEQIRGLLAAAGTPGAAMALTDRNETLHCAAFGVADFVGDRPVAADTLFEIGSIGKSFTAIALLCEVESGRLDLHAPVTRYLPWLEIRSHFEPITPHHLLNHTAGIINGRDFTGEGACEVWGLRETDAAWPPGSRFHYSNLGYKTLGLVLEAVTGRSYAEVISERILEPLGMESTHAVTTYETRTRQAVGHAPLRDDRPHVPGGPLVPAPWVETATGDGCIASTGADMAAYVRMLLHGGRGVLSSEGWDLLTTPTSEETDGTPYAYGLNIRTDGTVGHGGSTNGFHAEILADPAAGVGAVVLLNGPGPDVEIVEHALAATARVARSEGVPDLRLGDVDPTPFMGVYSARDRRVEVMRADRGLAVTLDAATHELHAHEDDCFVTDHPGLAGYLLCFEREEDAVTGFTHGPDVFGRGRDGSCDERAIAAGLCGHYRSHNPWYSNFRVVARRGALVLIWGWGQEYALEKVGDDRYRVGDGPEVVAFDPPLAGAVRRVRFLGGGDYYRTFT